MNRLSQSKGIPIYLLHLENHPDVFIALGKGKGGYCTCVTSDNLTEGMDPNVSARDDSQLMERCLFLLSSTFKVANLPSGFDDVLCAPI